MMFVKICGITREADADVAVACGASAIGFIFWPKSPRYVEPEHAGAIVRSLPPFVTPVGVFVNETAAHVNAVADAVGLGAVQLHGDETPDMAAALRRPVVKALARIDAATVAAWPDRVRLLIDADDPARRGGTGARADWDAAANLARSRPILLAGGITPANVVEAVARVRPFGIDVSSGVEDAPGLKNADRIRDLFEALRLASRS
jgi:phosphoribosylanthranilate isomerase